MLRVIKRKIYPIISKYLLRATIVEGFLRETECPFRCLIIGDSLFTEYLQAKMYAEPPVVVKKWRIWNPALKKLILNPPNSIDMCIAVLPTKYESTFHGLYDFKCQGSVHQIIDTTGTWEDVRKRFSRRKRQITKDLPEKFNLGYRISNDLEDFNFFYHRMHIPHIKKQFGKLAFIDSYDAMKKIFLNGFLLLVISGKEAVAGSLCQVKDKVLISHRMGVLDGDESHILSGAQTAVSYFELIYANEQNLHSVDVGNSPPFFNDGVYRHKRDWGATVLPNEESNIWVYFFHTGSPEKIAYFYNKNPAIVYTDEGLKGVTVIEGNPVAQSHHYLYQRGVERSDQNPGLD